MGKKSPPKSHSRSRLATPWDDKKDLSILQRFVRRHYRILFKARHPKLKDTNEAKVINSFTPSQCPYCGSEKFKKRAFTPNGIQRYQCSSCRKSFVATTYTIFDSHKIAISEWIDYCLNLFRYVSLNADSWNNRNAFSTSQYWLGKLFLILQGIQDDVILNHVVWMDETYYPLVNSQLKRTSEGKKLPGISENQICIGVATDRTKLVCFEEGVGKMNADTTCAIFRPHIAPGSLLIHDGDNTHQRLIDELNLRSEVHLSEDTKDLPDEKNPLDPINDLHDKLKKFLNAHSGFNRKHLQDYLNLFAFVKNPPNDPLEKVEKVLRLAFSTRTILRYRDQFNRADEEGLPW